MQFGAFLATSATENEMYNSVFNLDFGRSVDDIRSSKVARTSTLFRTTFKSGTEFTSLPYIGSGGSVPLI